MKTAPITSEKCFEDFQSSFVELQEVIEEINLRGIDPHREQHLIRSFELTHELALKTMTEYFRQQGRPPYSGSRDVTIDAFDEEIIDDGKGWLDMIIGRIKATSIYTEDVQHEMRDNIMKYYIHLFENFEVNMKNKLNL
ncbi:HI0074 family nucleotidyltransferase substrate-binding subunit [Echinicola jeungdonensis]|uniref:HI0074 family nucleotidyltransferase substrate-binding subunit n=1 Tax=Echinicola jeungdonensis TaxID=709343 RepID=A0ABV5J7Y1_9BACT|nr:HI0074 family nucleotidyltransferase substrate-binding subunit [Echinicola jeungdonensis]MDN3669996.1 HI0074 family nucleotidyltransferase substrate-binding subunit [Echinicola jeungdonensis]